jgi:tRNA U34 5-carboxymethylaminomethyl modifying GTPase MnmE/TrmE
VGKSSFINSLLQKSALPIYTLATSSRGPTTTTYAQEVTVAVKGKQIRLVDTPGISWAAETTDADADDADNIESIRARDILMRSKGRIDRLKDPIWAGEYLGACNSVQLANVHITVKHIVSRSNTEDLMLLYSLPAFSAGDTDSFLSCVARAHQLVKKVRPAIHYRSSDEPKSTFLSRKVNWTSQAPLALYCATGASASSLGTLYRPAPAHHHPHFHPPMKQPWRRFKRGKTCGKLEG